MQTSIGKTAFLKSLSRVAKKDWNKVWHQAQCTSTCTSLLHFDVELSNSQNDSTENKHLKWMVTLLVGEN